MAKKPQSLATKLCAIMKVVETIITRGENETDGYTYKTEGDVKEAFRIELAKRRIFIGSRVLSTNRFPITLHLRGGDIDTFVTECRIEWTFYDGDGDAPIMCIVNGAGEDQKDKGVYKALTGSLKALLMSSFLLRSGDDPDESSKSAGKETREKKVEAAQAVGAAKLAGTFGEPTPGALWYTYPDAGKGLEALVRGSDEMLDRHKETLMFHGKWSAKNKGYIVPKAKLEDLQFVLAQSKVDLKGILHANDSE